MESKAAYEANKPTEPTYKVDATEDVFKTLSDPATFDADVKNGGAGDDGGAKKKKKINKKKKSVAVEAV